MSKIDPKELIAAFTESLRAANKDTEERISRKREAVQTFEDHDTSMEAIGGFVFNCRAVYNKLGYEGLRHYLDQNFYEEFERPYQTLILATLFKFYFENAEDE